MNAKELAALLNGREYGSETTRAEEAQAKAAGLVVVFGYSDDNAELRGAIDDEVSCYNGTTIYLTSAGLLTNDCDNEDCPHFAKMKEQAATIKAVWGADGYSWIYKTDITHETFEIFEDGDKYCRGIVFALADVKGGVA